MQLDCLEFREIPMVLKRFGLDDSSVAIARALEAAWKLGRARGKVEATDFFSAASSTKEHLKEEENKAYLDIRYGLMWHSYVPKRKWDLDLKCHCCGAVAERRIDWNCWGTVYEADVCSSCAEKYDGACSDGIPLYKDNK